MAQISALVILLLSLLMPLTATAATVYSRDNTLNDVDNVFWSEELETPPAVMRPQRDTNNDFFAFGSIFETLLDILSTLRDATVGHILPHQPAGPSSFPDVYNEVNAVPDAVPDAFPDAFPDAAVPDAIPDAAPEANEILAPAADVAAAAAAKAEFYEEQSKKRVKKQHTSADSSIFNDVHTIGDHIRFDSGDNSITF